MNIKADQQKDHLVSQFIRYVVLNIFGMMGISFYILADTFFVAKGLGSDGLTALNLAIPIYSVVSGLGMMIGMGSGTRYSILKGEQDNERGNHVFSLGVIFALVLGIVAALIGIFLSNPISSLLGAKDHIHEMTGTYLKVILIFAPFFMLNSVLICFVRNDNNPKLAMLGMIVGSLANIVLDYVFIFPFNMGIFGAVLATGLSPIISIGILSFHFIKGKASFHFVKSKFKFAIIKDISALGAPSFISELSSGIVIIVFNGIILSIHGNLGVAAYAVVANVALVVIAIFNGVAQGAQPLLSTNYGQQKIERVKKVFHMGIGTVLVLFVIIYGISFFYTDGIVAIFNSENNAELAKLGVEGIRIYFTAFFFMSLNIIFSGYFSSCDAPAKAFSISILRGFLVIIPVIFLLASLLQMQGVWMALTVTEGIVFLVSLFFYIREKKSGNR